MKASDFRIPLIFISLLIFQTVHAGKLGAFERNVKSPPQSEKEAPPSRDYGASSINDNCGLFCALLRILFWSDDDDYKRTDSYYRDSSPGHRDSLQASASPKVLNDGLYAARTTESFHSSEEIAGTPFKASFEIAGAVQAGEGDLSGGTIDLDAKIGSLYLKTNISSYVDSEETLDFNSYGVGFNFDLGKQFNMGLLLGLQTLDGQFYQTGFWASIAMDLKLKPWMWIVLDASNAQFKSNSVNDIQLGIRFFPNRNLFLEPYIQRKSLEFSSQNLNFVGLKLGVLF